MSMVNQLVLDSEVPDKVEDVQDVWLQGYLCSQHECCRVEHVTDDTIKEFASDYDKEFGRDNFDQGDVFPWDDNDDEWMRQDGALRH
jgi:hypothetical protein